ncbi:MAG: hypothetical protein N2Z23_10015 [Pyrinomonadaceae bacterium]|nr:hypothetical protein [Pyrinomonadaceae bacterium]MCX7640759.1 hypothetical protein [Pyrinomonadaceae bacterium]MDW8304654.1 hypothetical protein [Acidobacteriota bacterium]
MKEQVFFNDEAIDKLMGVVMVLASEVYILRDRLKAIEKLLDERGFISSDEIENSPFSIEPSEREKFIQRLFDPILPKASSKVESEFQID